MLGAYSVLIAFGVGKRSLFTSDRLVRWLLSIALLLINFGADARCLLLFSSDSLGGWCLY